MSGLNKIVILVLLVIITSCSKDSLPGNDKLPKVKDAELQEIMTSLVVRDFETYYAKISTKYTDSSTNMSFKTSIRIRRDSIVNATITYAGIPIMNSIISTDSIHLTNKREKCYILESLAFFKESFGVDFSYQNIEELFLGLPVGFDPEKKYFRTDDPYSYTLSSHRKKDIRKNERKDMREIIMYYTLSDDLQKLDRIQIESPGDSASIVINYLNRGMINNKSLPVNAEIKIYTPRQEIEIIMNFKKTRLNEVENIHFVIPEDYERCK